MDEFTLPGLRAVREVARQGSFSAAADALGYTQSAISRQVALVERAAGTLLFERRPRGVTLTAPGEIVVRHATAALAELDSARAGLAEAGRRRRARVTLGAFSSAMAGLVPDAIAWLRTSGAGVDVVLREGTSPRLIDRVASGRIDLAVASPGGRPVHGVSFERLLDDPLLVALPRDHRLAGQAAVDPDELQDDPWITGSAESGSTLLGAWDLGAWEPRIAFEVRDWNAKIGLVSRGLGITLVPGLSRHTLPKTAVAARLRDPRAMRPVALAMRPGTSEPHVVSVTESLRRAAARNQA